jgi:hypothetical protein
MAGAPTPVELWTCGRGSGRLYRHGDGGNEMALHYLPEWLDENLPEDFDPSDLSPYRALDRHADFVAEQLESPPLVTIDLEGDSVEMIRQKLQPPGGAPRGLGCGASEET